MHYVQGQVQPDSRQRDRTAGWIVIAALCCVLAFALRLYKLEDQSLWLDEGATYYFAAMPVADLLSATFNQEPNPPLYYLLIHAWVQLAGASEFSLRFMSVLAGVANVALVYRLGRDILSSGAAAGAALLSACSPYLIWYSQEARMYSLLAALATLAMLALWRACDRGGWRAWALFGFFQLLTLYVHFYGVFVLGASAVFTLLSLGRMRVRRAWPLWGPTFLVAFLLYLPWLTGSLRAGAADASWRQQLGIEAIVVRSVTALTHNGFLQEPNASWLAIALAVEIVIGLALLAGPGERKALSVALLISALALPSVGIFIVSLRQPIFAERYISLQAPFLLLAVSAAPGIIFRRLPPFSLLWYAAIAFVFFGAMNAGWQDPRFYKEDYRSAGSYLEAHSTASDVTVLVAEYVRLPFGYYYRGPARVVPLIGDFEQPNRLLEPVLNGRDKVWLVLSHAEQVDPREHVKQWLGERFPLATEQYPTGIQLLGYRAFYRRSDLPADAIPLSIRYGAVELVGYSSDNRIPAADKHLHPPSNWLHVTLYWRAVEPIEQALRSSVRMVNDQGVWGEKLTRPTETLAFFPTNRWQPGEIVVEDVDVNLNPVTPSGSYSLEVRLLDPDGQPIGVDGGSPIIGKVEIANP